MVTSGRLISFAWLPVKDRYVLYGYQ